MRNWTYRLLRFEFWPWWAFYLPMVPMYVYCAIRTRKLLYFTAVNPSISMGGFFGEQKEDILLRIPQDRVVRSVLVRRGENPLEVHRNTKMPWPCFLKPNVGERGHLVVRAHGPEDLEAYRSHDLDFIIQEAADLPCEYGVLVYRTAEGTKVRSLCRKEFMSVRGDGVRTVRHLVQAHPRHRLYLSTLEREHAAILDVVPDRDTDLCIHHIGNHIKGTRFLNRNWEIDAELEQTFDRLMTQIEGFDCGRFDLKTDSIEALKQGRFKVFEFNGVSSEPGHIYDRGNVFYAWFDLIQHWDAIRSIAAYNIKKGVKTTPLDQFLVQVWDHFRT